MADQKIAVVTGGTAGLGRWIAHGIARAGYHVVLLARDAGRGEATRRWIAERAPGASTELVLADLSSLAQTRAAGHDIAVRHPRVDVLVNNAGLITPRREVTLEGHERIITVNHLAPFALTQALQGALQAGSPARVVNVGSTASDRATINVDDLELERGWFAIRAYGRSKLAMMMATFEWSRRLPDVAVNVVISPEQGADTPLHAALSPQLNGTTGAYLKRRQQARPNRLALDRSLTGRLWSETMRRMPD